jgi:NADH-quinone oxidoreductase subunit K
VAPLEHYLIVSALLFAIGVVGVVVRRNAIVVVMSIEIMLNAGNLAFVTFGRFLDSMDGQLIVFFVMGVAAAEAAIGLAILILIYRNRESTDVDNLNLLKL